MAKITTLKIQSRDKTRCNVYLDGEFAFGVSVENVYKFGLKVGKELSKDEIEELGREDQTGLALSKAISYATKALKTRFQVKTNLEKKGYDAKTVNFVLDKLTSNGLIDDVEYAKRYIETTSSTQGKKLIEYKLRSKGVKKPDIDYAFSLVSINSKENAYSVLEKKLKNKSVTKEDLNKAYRYLVGRGFSYDEVSSAISEYKTNYDTFDEEF